MAEGSNYDYLFKVRWDLLCGGDMGRADVVLTPLDRSCLLVTLVSENRAFFLRCACSSAYRLRRVACVP